MKPTQQLILIQKQEQNPLLNLLNSAQPTSYPTITFVNQYWTTHFSKLNNLIKTLYYQLNLAPVPVSHRIIIIVYNNSIYYIILWFNPNHFIHGPDLAVSCRMLTALSFSISNTTLCQLIPATISLQSLPEGRPECWCPEIGTRLGCHGKSAWYRHQA